MKILKWTAFLMLCTPTYAQPGPGDVPAATKAAQPAPRVLPRHFLSGDLRLPAVKTFVIYGKRGDTTAKVKIDGRGIIELVEVSGANIKRMQRSITTVNARTSVSVQIPPPAGQPPGKYGQAYERDDAFFGPALREYLSHSHGIKMY